MRKTKQPETQQVSRLVALKSRQMNGPRVNISQTNAELHKRYVSFCLAAHYVFVTLLFKRIIFGGIWKLLSAIVRVAIFLYKKTELFANWLFYGSAKRREVFFKGYMSVMGVMLAFIANGIWLNAQNNMAWGTSFKEQLPAIERIVAEHGAMKRKFASLGQDSGEDLYQTVLANEVRRLNPSCSAEQAVAGLDNFLNFVVELESKGDQFAVSRSGAVSYTQFLRTYKGRFDRGPMDTGLNRWASYTNRHGVDPHSQWFNRAELRKNPYRFMGIPLRAQQAFTLVNIAEESGNDQNLRKAACGDANAAVYLYVYKHHRDPGKEKFIWDNVQDKLPGFYPGYKLNRNKLS